MRNTFVGNIVLPDRILYGGTVVCEDGNIKEIISLADKVKNGGNRTNLPYICPGLVDIHNHGAMGHDYMEANAEAFNVISEYLVRHGVTTAQCTTVSAPIDQLKKFLEFFRREYGSKSIRPDSRKTEEKSCRFCGVHIEGPYISVKNKGAHTLETLLTPLDGYNWVLDYSDVIGEITLSPELPGMPKMIEDLCKAGIVVSGGHDDANPEDIIIGVDKGMSHCTHIYCAMSTLHKIGRERRCGLCEYAMTHDTCTAEIIGDNHHIPPDLAKMIYHAKGADKLCLVSDAIAPAGLTEKVGSDSVQLYSLGIGEGCTKVFVEDNVAIVEDGSCYAGSVQALDQMIRNMVQDCNIPLVDAIRMASLTSAKIIGIAGDCGSVEIGKRADLCIMDSNLQMMKTIVAGELVYERSEGSK